MVAKKLASKPKASKPKASKPKTEKKPRNYSRKTILTRKEELSLAELAEFCFLMEHDESSYSKRYFEFYFNVDYEYDYYHACQHGSSCCDNDYCRCGKVIDEKIEKINDFSTDNKLSILDKYFLDRIVRICGVFNTDNWELQTSGGYYGEEIDGPSLDSSIKSEIYKVMKEGSKLSDAEKIKKTLILEYGFLLDKLKSLDKVKILCDSPHSIIMSNEYYFKKIDTTLYKEHTLPLCVVHKRSDGKYMLVDGYHRLGAAIIANKEQIQFLELYK